PSVDQVDAASITEKELRYEYVYRSKPCLLVGACKDWKAVSWTLETLRRAQGDKLVRIHRTPIVDYPDTEKARSINAAIVASIERMPLRQFLDEPEDRVGMYYH